MSDEMTIQPGVFMDGSHNHYQWRIMLPSAAATLMDIDPLLPTGWIDRKDALRYFELVTRRMEQTESYRGGRSQAHAAVTECRAILARYNR